MSLKLLLKAACPMYAVHILNHAPHMFLKAEPTDSWGTARAEQWYHAVTRMDTGPSAFPGLRKNHRVDP